MIDCTSKCNIILFQRIAHIVVNKKEVKDLTLTFPSWVLVTVV